MTALSDHSRDDDARSSTRVLIVDDHDLFAESLRFALEVAGFATRRAPDTDATSVLELARSVTFDVVLLDLHLGPGDVTGIPLVGPLQATGARVVMVTGTEEPARMGECLEAGACSVVNKSEPLEALIHATIEASHARSVNSPEVRAELLAALRLERSELDWRIQRLDRLTAAEREVLAALCEGLAAEDIAQRRVVSIRTVRSQIEAILSKLDVGSQLGAVAIANRAGWRG